MMPAVGPARRRPDGDGHRSAGRPFYLMEPIPPEDDPKRSATSSPSTRRSTSAGTNCRRPIRDGAVDSTGDCSAGRRRARCRWANSANIGSSSRTASGSARSCRRCRKCRCRSGRYYIGVDDIDRAVAAINDNGGTVLNGSDGNSRRRIRHHSAWTRRAQRSAWSAPAKPEGEKNGQQQAHHLPVVRQGRSAQGRGILCVRLPRHPCRTGA